MHKSLVSESLLLDNLNDFHFVLAVIYGLVFFWRDSQPVERDRIDIEKLTIRGEGYVSSAQDCIRGKKSKHGRLRDRQMKPTHTVDTQNVLSTHHLRGSFQHVKGIDVKRLETLADDVKKTVKEGYIELKKPLHAIIGALYQADIEEDELWVCNKKWRQGMYKIDQCGNILFTDPLFVDEVVFIGDRDLKIYSLQPHSDWAGSVFVLLAILKRLLKNLGQRDLLQDWYKLNNKIGVDGQLKNAYQKLEVFASQKEP